VSKDDKFCKNCGTNLTEVYKVETPSLEEKLYERRFSLSQRFHKLLTSPSEAMKDVAFSADYEGIFVIIVIEAVLYSVSIALILQRIQITGPHAAMVSSLVTSIMAFTIVLAVILFVIKWLIKSLIVKYTCNSGSSWDFKTAAAITGYAYIADVILGFLGTMVLFFSFPTFTIDTANLGAMEQALTNYRAQFERLRLVYTLPTYLFGLIWKSYLGGLGTYFGTKEKCSIGKGFILFFFLGLLSLLLTFGTL
jgi:hypothetical protein